MQTLKLSSLLSVLTGALLLTGCPDDDTTPGATEGATEGDDDGGTSPPSTSPPATTVTMTMPPTTADDTAGDDMTDDDGPVTDDGMTTDDGGTATDTGPATDDGMTTDTGATDTGTDTGAASDCAQVTLVGDLQADPDGQVFRINGQLLGDAGDDQFQLEFYTGDTGTFDLAAGMNINYATCNQCVRIFEDLDEKAVVQYFQSEGSIEVDAESAPLGTSMIATLQGVTLVEVTVAMDFVSTPVVGGGCVEIADVTLSTPMIAGWNCDPSYYDDGSCDCGCGIIDLDCADATAASCEYCNEAGSCDTSGGGCPGIIDPVDNSTCSDDAPAGWTCAAVAYNDGTCDCGCGEPDVFDCADDSIETCDQCNGMGSCGAGQVGCVGVISPADTTTCQTTIGWTCNPAYIADADCDCGCGVADPTCPDATAASCEYCNNAGSCDTTGNDCPGIIDPANNAVCI